MNSIRLLGTGLELEMPIADAWQVWCRQRGFQGDVEIGDDIVRLLIIQNGEKVTWVEGPHVFIEGFINGYCFQTDGRLL
jgi:hypothetical protein